VKDQKKVFKDFPFSSFSFFVAKDCTKRKEKLEKLDPLEQKIKGESYQAHTKKNESNSAYRQKVHLDTERE
jgi:hypothetical protein